MKMTTKENREEFSGSAKESQACLFLRGGLVNATGGKTTGMRRGKGADEIQRGRR